MERGVRVLPQCGPPEGFQVDDVIIATISCYLPAARQLPDAATYGRGALKGQEPSLRAW